MKYFIDTEFVEGSQKKLFGKTKLTIDLISIGIVAEDGREYYAISKDFNIRETWNRYYIEEGYNSGDIRNIIGDKWKRKVYWLRDNVLSPIWEELRKKELTVFIPLNADNDWFEEQNKKIPFTYKNLKRLINKYGKTNKQIADEIVKFVYYKSDEHRTSCCLGFDNIIKPEFYGYYADYDWVVFCWLFGRMIDLPKGFSMYCIDLMQELKRKSDLPEYKCTVNDIKNRNDYPKQTNEHNALSDAKWNFELYKFLNTI